jgi:hypothetical protein
MEWKIAFYRISAGCSQPASRRDVKKLLLLSDLRQPASYIFKNLKLRILWQPKAPFPVLPDGMATVFSSARASALPVGSGRYC